MKQMQILIMTPYGIGLQYRDLISRFVGEHRDKIPKKGERRSPFNALIARPVGSSERQTDPRAKAAMDKEWQTLRDKEVWDESDVREWDTVAEQAVANGEEKHFGWLFGICVEKNHELDIDDPKRKMKGRVVFQGNMVTNQTWEAAIFQDLGSSPATMEASRVCDMWGCCPGHDSMQADAPQAYIQTELIARALRHGYASHQRPAPPAGKA